MPRSATTGVYTRVVNSFSQPVFGTLIDPTDADAYFDDLDVGLNPANLAGPTNIIGALTLGKAGTTVGTLGFFNATSGSITISPPTGALGSVTMTLPDATDTFVGLATTDILLNKTFVAPVLGAATATSINKYTFTTPATAATLTILNNKTATFNNSITFAGTDATTMTFPTTTATIARTDAGQTFTGNQAISGTFAVTSASATALAVGLNGATNPAFVVDDSTASQVAGLSVKGAVTGGTVSLSAIDSGATTNLQIKAKGAGAITLQADAGSSTVVNFGVAASTGATITLAGSSSGALTLSPPSAAAGTLNLAPGTLTGSSASAVWFDNIPQNSKSAAYTTVLADAQKHILHPSADTTARIFTIDSNANVAYPIGTGITFVNQNAGGVITIAITSDTMRLAGPGTTGSRTLAANGIATALKLTSTEWIISGTGLT